MGEARQRQTLTKRLLEQHPNCIYCGGINPGDDVDHAPPISMFDGRQRPRGLMFSACRRCHTATRVSDSLAGIVSRFYPDPTTEVQRGDIEKTVKAMCRHHPEIVREFGLDRTYQREGPVPLNVGDMLSGHMNRFAARMGFALHFEKTGAAIPLSGAVFVRWYSNDDAIRGNVPLELFQVLGPDTSLRQGRFSVEDQYSYATADDGERHAFFCTFRKSFATLSFTANDVGKLTMPEGGTEHPRLFRPGFLWT